MQYIDAYKKTYRSIVVNALASPIESGIVPWRFAGPSKVRAADVKSKSKWSIVSVES